MRAKSSSEQESNALVDGIHQPEQVLTSAIAGAVRRGLDELARLDGFVADAESRLSAVREDLDFRARVGSKGEDGFFRFLEEVVGDLRAGLAESRRAAGTFNIAFFGRTGTGKSTLLSALG